MELALKLFRGILLVCMFLLVVIILLSVFTVKSFFHIPIASWMREITLVFWGLFILFVFMRKNFVQYIDQISNLFYKILSSKYYFTALSFMMLLYFLYNTYLHWVGFHISVADFGYIDDSIQATYNGKFMYSNSLGHSFFAEHFSPILLLIVPFHYIFKTPITSMVFQALVIWSSLFIFKAIMKQEKYNTFITNFACTVFINSNAIIGQSQVYIHQELFMFPIILLMYLSYRKNNYFIYWLSILLALAVKEDVGLYLAGFSAYVVIADKNKILGVVTFIITLTYSFVALKYIMPIFIVTKEYKFFEGFWGIWGKGMGGILIGFLHQPVLFFKSFFSLEYLKRFLQFLFIPFLKPWGVLIFLAPWVVYSTALGHPGMAGLGGYCGAMLFSFMFIAIFVGLKSKIFFKVSTGYYIKTTLFLLLVLNTGFFWFPKAPDGAAQYRKEIKQIPLSASIQAIPCFYPYTNYSENRKALYGADKISSNYILIRDDQQIYGWTGEQLKTTINYLKTSKQYTNVSTIKNLYIFKKCT